MQLPDGSDRQDKNQNIRQDAHAGADLAESGGTDAIPLDVRAPVVCNGPAGKDGQEKGTKTEDRENPEDHPGAVQHQPGTGEDANVEEKDRGFDEKDGDGIDGRESYFHLWLRRQPRSPRAIPGLTTDFEVGRDMSSFEVPAVDAPSISRRCRAISDPRANRSTALIRLTYHGGDGQ